MFFCTFRATYNATKSSKQKEVTARTRSTLLRIFLLIAVGITTAMIVGVLHLSSLSKALTTKYGVYPGEAKEPLISSSSEIVSSFANFYLSNGICIAAVLAFRRLPESENLKTGRVPETPTARKTSRVRRTSANLSRTSGSDVETEGKDLAIVPTFAKVTVDPMSSSLGVEAMSSPVSPTAVSRNAD